MHGTTFAPAPAATKSFSDATVAPMREGIVYALLGLALIGATVPIGPAFPVGEHGAVATACLGPADAGWRFIPCTVDEQIALASALTPAESAALMP